MIRGRDVEVLDHGYVSLVETWGSEERIIESARMSTGKGFKEWGGYEHGTVCGRRADAWSSTPDSGSQCPCGNPQCWIKPKEGDEKLLRHLYTNRHMTPFEMAGATFEVQAPIFVFREWHRHRTQSYNEMSARYTPLPDVNYVPSVERLLMNAKRDADGKNKQAGTIPGALGLSEPGAAEFCEALRDAYARAEKLYQDALQGGVPKELARLIVPVGRYSRMRASANLRNWMQFLTLRDDKNAQWEIQQYAAAVREMLKSSFPRTMALFAEGR